MVLKQLLSKIQQSTVFTLIWLPLMILHGKIMERIFLTVDLQLQCSISSKAMIQIWLVVMEQNQIHFTFLDVWTSCQVNIDSIAITNCALLFYCRWQFYLYRCSQGYLLWWGGRSRMVRFEKQLLLNKIYYFNPYKHVKNSIKIRNKTRRIVY